MINLEYHSEQIKFVNITRNDLPLVLERYNNISDNMYGTGIDKPMTLDDLDKKYNEIAASNSDYFLWIINNNVKIGIIKGSIKYRENDSIWINTLIIDAPYRRRGFGLATVDALIKNVYNYNKFSKVYVSVVEDNEAGITFWNRIGFIAIKKMSKHIFLGNKYRDVIIMYKLV